MTGHLILIALAVMAACGWRSPRSDERLLARAAALAVAAAAVQMWWNL